MGQPWGALLNERECLKLSDNNKIYEDTDFILLEKEWAC